MARQFVAASSQYATLTNAVWANAFPVSLSIWMRPDTAANRLPFGLYDSVNAGSRAVRLQQRSATNIVRAEHRDGTTATLAQTSVTYNLSLWNSLGGSYSSNSNRTVYLNGGNSVNDTVAATVAMATNKVLIGAQDNGGVSAYFDGRLSNACIHDVALNADEMQSIGLRINPFRIRTSAVLAYWPLGVGSAEPNLAKQGGTLNMTLMNSPAIADSAPVSPLFF